MSESGSLEASRLKRRSVGASRLKFDEFAALVATPVYIWLNNRSGYNVKSN